MMNSKKTSDPVIQGVGRPKNDSEVFNLLDAAAQAIRRKDYWKAKSDLSGAMGIVDQRILDVEHAGQKPAKA